MLLYSHRARFSEDFSSQDALQPPRSPSQHRRGVPQHPPALLSIGGGVLQRSQPSSASEGGPAAPPSPPQHRREVLRHPPALLGIGGRSRSTPQPPSASEGGPTALPALPSIGGRSRSTPQPASASEGGLAAPPQPPSASEGGPAALPSPPQHRRDLLSPSPDPLDPVRSSTTAWIPLRLYPLLPGFDTQCHRALDLAV